MTLRQKGIVWWTARHRSNTEAPENLLCVTPGGFKIVEHIFSPLISPYFKIFASLIELSKAKEKKRKKHKCQYKLQHCNDQLVLNLD